MRAFLRVVVASASACFLLGQSMAHHSPVQYEMSEIVEISGTVIEFEFRNPHSYIHVRDSDDAEWMLETSSAVRLSREGWSSELFSPGDEVTVRAHPNANRQKSRLYLNSISKATGESFAILGDRGESPEARSFSVAESLNGIWQVDTENFGELFASFRSHPLTEKARLAQASYDETTDPVADCIAYPTPHLVFVSFIYPMRIDLTGENVVFHHEFFDTKRTVYMDASGHPGDTEYSNQGHSIGRWEGETLVVDTRYFAEHGNPMMADFPSSTEKHVVERYTLSADGSHATADIFIEDPEFLPEPLSYQLILRYAPEEKIQDFECDPEIAKRYTE